MLAAMGGFFDTDRLIHAIARSDFSELQLSGSMVLSGTHAIRLRLAASTVPGEPDKPNEDAFGIVPAGGALFVGVFDGTTSLRPIEGLERRGVNGARFASHFLRNGLHIAREEMNPQDVLIALNEALFEASKQFEGVDPEDTNTLPATSATIVKIDPGAGELQLASVYDSWCVVYYKDGRSELLTVDLNKQFDQQVVDLMQAIAARQGITPRAARQHEEVERALLESRVVKNNAPDGSGCGVVNGDPDMVPYIQTRAIELARVSAVLLGTDGLVPQGWSIERQADRRRLADELKSGGLGRLIGTKKRSEDADPDWHHVRFKHSDDATGLFLSHFGEI